MTEKLYDVTALGEILIDFTEWGFSDDGARLFAQNPGGAVANVAAAVARLGGRAAFVGKVGADMHGTFLRQTLWEAGVDVSGVATDADSWSGRRVCPPWRWTPPVRATPSGAASCTDCCIRAILWKHRRRGCWRTAWPSATGWGRTAWDTWARSVECPPWHSWRQCNKRKSSRPEPGAFAFAKKQAPTEASAC